MVTKGASQRNKDLQKIYNMTFKNGEKKHFTKLLFSKKKIPSEEQQVLKEIHWKGKSVLDIGCGTGLLVHEIAKRGGVVMGVDYSKEAIDEAKATRVHPRAEYRVEDIQEKAKKYKKKFDVVVSLGTLEHLDDPMQKLSLFASFLNPKGEIIITSPNWTNPRGFVLQTIFRLFNAPITLADLHYFSPRVFEQWAKKKHYILKWHTFDVSWGTGKKMLEDLKHRLPNVLRDMNMQNNKGIESLLIWLEEEALTFPWEGKHIGATALYRFKKMTLR